MNTYRATARYRGVHQFDGRNDVYAFNEGDVAELSDVAADFLNRDCPGLLVRAKGTKKGAEKKPTKAALLKEATALDITGRHDMTKAELSKAVAAAKE